MHKENLVQLKRELADLEATLREKEINVNRCSQATNRHHRDQRDSRAKKQRAQELVERLRDELEAETPQDGKLEALQVQLQEAEEESEMHARSYTDAVEAKDGLNDAQKQLKSQLDAAQREIEEAEAKVHKADLKTQKLREKRHTALLQKNVALQRIEDARADREQHARSREAQVEVVQKFVDGASQVCERVPIDPSESALTLDKKLERLHKDLAAQQREYVAHGDVVSREKNAD